MKHNKFIPLAVLAGLCIVGIAMNNQQCAAEQSSKPACVTKECSDVKKPCNTKKSCRIKCGKKAKMSKTTKCTK